MKTFKDLEAYKSSKQLAVTVYTPSKTWPKEEQYGLTSQIRRASISITSNLAEGCGRTSSKDTLHFLAIARGACFERKAQTEIAFELTYLSADQLTSILEQINLTRKLLNGLMKRYQTL